MGERKTEKTYLKIIGILLLAALLVEIFVFNIRSVGSLFYAEIQYPLSELSLQGIDISEDGVLHLSGGEGQSAIYLKNLNGLPGAEKIRNIRLDLELPDAYDRAWEESGILTITPYVRDAGHDQYDILADQVCRPEAEDSCYLWLKPSDPVKTIVLVMRRSEGDSILLKGITINAKRPFRFSLFRILFIFAIFSVIYLLRPSSFLWKDKVRDYSRKSILATVLVMACLITPAVLMNCMNGYSWLNTGFRPYQQLAEALHAGQFSLLEEPPQELADLENPYDITLRDAAGLTENADYLWDTVYYEGKYYCYFGPIPCVLFYLPLYSLTGAHLDDAALLLFLTPFVFAGIYLCLSEWLKRRYPETPQGYLLVFTAMAFLGSGMMTVLGGPDAHDVPRVCGLVFVLWGLYLWQRSMRAGRNVPSVGPLAAGSLLMALAVGCRPNMLLFSLFAIPFFLPYLKKGGDNDRQGRIRTLAGCLFPYAPVAIWMMVYNASRFGSILDFGYSYNLTVLDYTNEVVSADRIRIGLFEYLLRPPVIGYVFPFIGEGSFAQQNQLGHSSFYYTWHYGGMLCCDLLLWCLPGVWAARKKIRDGIYLAGIAFVNMLVNICVAGVAYHYRLDFAAFFLIAAALGAVQIRENISGGEGEKWLKRFLLLALLVSFVYYSCFLWSGTLAEGNTDLYYRLMYMFR